MDFQGWLVFAHVLATLVFFLFHGASATSVIALRRERDPARVKAILDLSMTGNYIANGAGVVLIVLGIWAGINGGWWTSGHLWLWLSVGLLVLVIAVMTVFMSRHYYRWRDLWKEGARPAPEQLGPLLSTPQPAMGAALGLIGVVVILWLMMAKPF